MWIPRMFDAGTTEIRWKLNARASRVTIRRDVFSDFGEYHVASKFGIKSDTINYIQSTTRFPA